jgi:V8-like Glu-specific endopeptidase
VKHSRQEAAIPMKFIQPLAVIATMAAFAGSVSTASAITKGKPDGNRHPFVGALVSYDPDSGDKYLTCSGTLIARDLFLTAAHCLEDEPSDQYVSFDSFVGAPDVGPDVTLYHGQAYGDPDFAGNTTGPGDTHDLAVVVLDKPLRAHRFARVAPVGTLDRLSKVLDRLRYQVVGYGREGHDDNGFYGGGGKRYAYSGWLSLSDYTFELDQSGDQGGSCNGDSGGPVFLGSTRLEVGITVDGDPYCQQNSINVRLDTQSAHDFIDPFLARSGSQR